MSSTDQYICIGAVAGAFGVRGEVRVKSFTETPDDIFDYAPFLDEAGAVVLSVVSWRPIKDGFAVFCDEAASREDAEAMKSVRLHAARARLPAPDEEEFYHADLIGMAVKRLDGRDLGLVRAVQNYGAGDLLEVHETPGAKGSWFLPFTKAAAPHVDLAKREVIADPPEGVAPEGGESA